MKIKNYYIVFLLLLVYGCSNIKYLSKDEKLYIGSEISLSKSSSVNTKLVTDELESVVSPKPNSSILGLRTKLWFYNIAGTNAKKGIKKWLRTKAGEPPVLLNRVDPSQTSDLMINRLNNMGYFNAKVAHTIVEKNKKVIIKYFITLNSPHTINKVFFPSGKDTLSMLINKSQDETLIKEGSLYNLDLLKNERERIDYFLKNSGFYYFNPEFILFKADSSLRKNSIDITLTLKPEIPEKAKIPYEINNIYIISSDTINTNDGKIKNDTIRIDGYHYIDRNGFFKPDVIIRNIVFKKGDVYNRLAHNMTISRLMGLGVFQFVSIKYIKTNTVGNEKLDARIILTPALIQSLRLQMEGITKSTNYTGPGLTLSYKNKNFLKEAELFVFNLNGTFETQLSGAQKGQDMYELGANTQIYIPGFIFLNKFIDKSSWMAPKTKFNLGFRMLSRPLYFDMNAINFSYGYTWKVNKQKEFAIDPLLINFAKLANTTKTFEKMLVKNPFLRKSFREQFTLGSKYSFTYHSANSEEIGSKYYFNTSLDLSGNSLYLIQSLMGSKKTIDSSSITSNEEYYKLSGYRYSQYSKLSTDTRYYFSFTPNNKIAMRLFMGVGVPYQNSSILPYIMQFFSGGPNSIRAFPSRKVGPGSYSTPDSLKETSFIDHAGDIKLEWNLEYRFPIISIVKGAIFTDAGNVWLIRKNKVTPEKEFHLNTFQNQIAVGTGFGIRADVSIFVLRFDLAFPLRIPTLPENERWVMDKISFGSKSWRNENLLLNIAIGYPF